MKDNETGGTRTHDLSIKSAVLYRLSYGLIYRFLSVITARFLSGGFRLLGSLTPVLTPARLFSFKKRRPRIEAAGVNDTT